MRFFFDPEGQKIEKFRILKGNFPTPNPDKKG